MKGIAAMNSPIGWRCPERGWRNPVGGSSRCAVNLVSSFLFRPAKVELIPESVHLDDGVKP